MNLKYLISLICFMQMLYYCNGAGNSSLEKSTLVKRSLLPDCYFSDSTTGFIVFTRENPDGIYVFERNLTSATVFNKSRISRKVIFLIHGFISIPNDTNFNNMAKALLKKDDLIVISVDWSRAACNGGAPIIQYLTYPKAVMNTRLVGKYVANFTKILVDKYKVPMSNIRLIGHSLGAHTSGFAGKEVQKLKLGKYSEIIGLDPAGPLFRWNDCADRLCVTDAQYVQVLHTSNLEGTMTVLGTTDFYINYGKDQPGCQFDESCSHVKVVKYITECIKHECCLIGTPWINHRKVSPFSQCTKEICVCVGLNAKKYANRGSFYVPVESNPPYCNNKGMKLEL